MIDDTKPRQRRPVNHISFVDLRALGFEILVQEFEKEKPNGTVDTAVKIVRVLKDGKVFEKQDMKEFLHPLGLDTRGENGKYWVRPKERHRCLTQKEPVFDYRIQAYERLDKEYIRSGRASMDAILFSSNMSDMSEIGDRMAKGGDGE